MLLHGNQVLLGARGWSKPSPALTSRSVTVFGRKSVTSQAVSRSNESTSFISKGCRDSLAAKKLKLSARKALTAGQQWRRHHDITITPSPISELFDAVDCVCNAPVLLPDEVRKLVPKVQQARRYLEQSSSIQEGLCDSLDELTAAVEEALTDFDQLLAQWEARADFGQLVSKFRRKASRKLKYLGVLSWPQLAEVLEEEDEEMEPEERVVTDALKRILRQMGFSWDDWQVMNSIACDRNIAFHPELNLEKVAEQIDVAPMPEGVNAEGARVVLHKVVQALRVKARR